MSRGLLPLLVAGTWLGATALQGVVHRVVAPQGVAHRVAMPPCRPPRAVARSSAAMAAQEELSITDDLFAIVGVSSDAEPSEIKRAYRSQAQLLHPDVNKKPNAEKQFRRLVAAFETLSDPKKRLNWEQMRASTLSSFGQRGFGQPHSHDSIQCVQGGALRTWSYRSPDVEQLQVKIETEGFPLDTDIEMWHGPENTPLA